MTAHAIGDPVARDNFNSYERDVAAGHREYVDFAKKCDRFYVGGGLQWSDEDKAKMEADGRPALEINMVLSTINTMKGEHEAQRADITFKPKRGAQEVADTLTKLVLNIQESNKYQYVEGMVFMDGLIQDRGYFDCRLDFSDHIRGEVRITAKDPLTVVLDPEAKEYDPKTWKRVTITEWMSVDDIHALYGKAAAEQVSVMAAAGGAFGGDSMRFDTRNNTFGGDEAWANQLYAVKDESNLRSIRVIERQHRKLGVVRFFVDNVTGDTREIPDEWDDVRLAKVAQMADVSIIKKVVARIRWTVSADGALIHDEWSPFKRFTIVPYFPYFRRGKPFGVVRNLISPQEQLNKLESQELHIINTTANSGWAVEAGSLINMTEEELEERGAETGLVLVYRKGGQAPEKIKPNTIPTGIDRAAAKSADSIRTISGVNQGAAGDHNLDVSGVTLKQAKLSNLTQMQVPFSNLNYSRQLLAESILEIIQSYYNETRVYQVTNHALPGKPLESIAINQPTPEGTVINDVTLGEYEVVASSAPARDNFEETQFAEAISLREAGVMIPDDVIIENSHMNDKMTIAERVRQMQGMGEPTPEEQQMMEFERQVAMRKMELELAEMEGKARKLMAESEALTAKADAESQRMALEAQRSGMEMQLAVQKLRQDWAKHMTNLSSKRELAEIHTQSKMENTMYTKTADRAMKEIEARSAFLAKQQEAKKPGAAPASK